MRRSPCIKECPYRSPTCHSECESYLEWKDERDALREVINNDTRIWITDRYKRKQQWFRNFKK